MRRIHQLGRCPNFGTKAAKIFFHELKRAFEGAFGMELPDALEELQASVLAEMQEARRDAGQAKKSNITRRGVDEFMKAGTADLKAHTSMSDLKGHTTAVGVGRNKTLQPGMNQRSHLIMETWADFGWASRGHWKDVASRKADAAELVALEETTLANLTTLVARRSNVLTLSVPSWSPKQGTLSGNGSCLLSESEWRDTLEKGHTCKNLESSWAETFNRPISMDADLQAISGPQIKSQSEADAGNGGDLTAKVRSSCAERGDCKRFGPKILRIGDIITGHVCTFISSIEIPNKTPHAFL
jgi:hypothetical protein